MRLLRSLLLDFNENRTSPPGASILTNHILTQLSNRERAVLLAEAEYAILPAGHTLARAGDAVSAAYFPERGVIACISEMTTGHQVGVACVGAEGMIGLSRVVGVPRHPYRVVALLESEGHHLPADTIQRAFDEFAGFRARVLADVGRRLVDVSSLVACSRVHSHRQRLARWILTISDKTRDRSISVTHEVLAQLVGGPRAAVTVALKKFGARGAITHVRGNVQIVSRALLTAEACECYLQPRDLTGSGG